MNLVIDQGNTQIKAALFENNQLISSYSQLNEKSIHSLISKHQPLHIILSSVGKPIEILGENVLSLNENTPLPFINNYTTPHTLGRDRLAGIAGSLDIYPNQNCLVIDMGTCITYDFVDNKKEYHGGAISPGMEMRFKALHTFTANLPLEEADASVSLMGASTADCIKSGVINGIAAEINEIIRMYSDNYAHLRIIICGGDSGFFENKIEASIFAAPELVLSGLNGILNYNVEGT